MHNLFNNSILVSTAVCLALFACGSQNNPVPGWDTTPAAKPVVQTLNAPEDGTQIDMKAPGTVTLSWAEAACDCEAFVQYQVLFSLSTSFTVPFKTLSSDGEGDRTSLTLTPETLEAIASAAPKDATAKSVTVHWAVRTINLDTKAYSTSTVSRSLVFLLASPTAVSRPYTNPLTSTKCADPSVFKGDDGYWYAFGTGARFVRYRSRDLANWEQLDPPFTVAGRPAHVEGSNSVWAPDLEYINGQYVLYYSQNVTMQGGNPNSTVGVATGPSLDGTFTDRGVLVQAKNFGIPGGCIDQFYFEEDGKKYLGLGSFKGIYLFELTDDGLSIKDNTKPVAQLAGNAYEGGMLHKHGDYYYLFASIGTCCDGKNSTYQLVVGRSTSLFGPYRNMAGESMLDNKHRVLLSSSDRFKGPGHCSEIIEDVDGNMWVFYHAFDMHENNGEPNSRLLMLDKITFGSKGWPNINDGYPSEGGMTPVME